MKGFQTRIKEVTHKTRDVVELDRRIAHFKKRDSVIIKRGVMKNLRGTIIPRTIKPAYSKNDFIVQVHVKDASKAIKGAVTTNKFWFKGSELKPTARKYYRLLPFSDKR